jgi:hypothetical protein
MRIRLVAIRSQFVAPPVWGAPVVGLSSGTGPLAAESSRPDGLCGRLRSHGGGEQFVYTAHKLLGFDRLANVAAKARRECTDFIAGGGECGYRQHGNVATGRILSQQFQHFEAIQSRQLQIANHQIRPPLPNQCDPPSGFLSRENCVAVVGQQAPGHLKTYRIVFYKENLGSHSIRETHLCELASECH